MYTKERDRFAKKQELEQGLDHARLEDGWDNNISSLQNHPLSQRRRWDFGKKEEPDWARDAQVASQSVSNSIAYHVEKKDQLALKLWGIKEQERMLKEKERAEVKAERIARLIERMKRGDEKVLSEVKVSIGDLEEQFRKQRRAVSRLEREIASLEFRRERDDR